MADLSVLSALENDFDTILVVDLESDSIEIQKTSSKNKQWINEFQNKPFSDFINFISNTFIFPEDRTWFSNTFSYDSVKSILSENRVFLLNHRVYNKNGITIYYQSKIARLNDDLPVTKFVFGGHSIDQSERNNVQYIQDAATSHHNAVIASLATDYDLICYYCSATKELTVFHSTEVFDSIVMHSEKPLAGYEQLNYFFSKLVYPDDYEKFKSEVSYSRVYEETRIYPSYEVHFRALISDQIYYYKLKFIPDNHNPDNFIIGLISFDEQVRSQIQRREREKARSIMEKQLEIMIVERTSEIQSKNQVLNRINEDIIEMLGDITEARDYESGEHIRRVKNFTHALASQVMLDWPEYKLTPDRVDLISSASALHDIGKIMIPDAILLKPGRLTPEEFEIMKTHTTKGCDLLKKAPTDWSSDYLQTSMEICKYHHEKFDGKGYPEGLCGDDIPLSAQIVSIADCYDALTAKRVYKDAIPVDEAVQMITEGKCGVFSPKLMESFLKCKAQFANKDLMVQYAHNNIIPNLNAGKLTNMRVLFVEDSEMSRMIGREMLEGEGATVVEAENGKIAIDLFQNMSPGTYDAIVMDVNMPIFDGPEATRRIRSLDHPDAKSIPIIALTASEEMEDLQRCLNAGMNCYITKPVKIAELTDVLLKLKKNRS